MKFFWVSISGLVRTVCPITKFDVFLSFRGKDVRTTFISHLLAQLLRKKIYTFKDDDEMVKGKDIREFPSEAIKQSRIAIVTLSKGYADSKWCLDELATIVECKETKGLIVLPVFHGVEPNEVRHQTGSFKDAFAKHEKIFGSEIVQRWRNAMTEVSYLSGFCLSNSRDEAQLVEQIVASVTKRLNQSILTRTRRPRKIHADHISERPNYSHRRSRVSVGLDSISSSRMNWSFRSQSSM